MFEQLRRRRPGSERREARSETGARSTEQANGSSTSTRSFQLARLLYGGVLAFMAVDNLRNLDERIGYAESKGAPMPERTVPAISGALLAGSLGIALWRLPRVAVAGVVSFLLGVTPVMHDFWSLEGEERAEQQIHFLKNSALLGGALAFLEIARRSD